MSVNPYKAHLLVLPEDGANRQMANGFLLDPGLNPNAIRVLPEARGWRKVIEKFNCDQSAGMRTYTERRFLLLLDFDGDAENRKKVVAQSIPEDIKDRVFVLGVASEPEALKRESGMNFEAIGETLAKDCTDNRQDFWNHDLLKHNEPELNRLIDDVRPFLFGSK